ncbi:YdcF family protein [Flavihumibacter sp. UBA7668]|uniref:YdcF family protein n=1 Tax=Flavihumibacter sp. UBA7668 TaxID=1946542 RepID=UPI0025B8C081|nr:YdcF family protein [Flavihumibacter sp. UBA7668]
MLPLLSKIVTFFLSPANWILVIALLFLIGKPGNWKRRYGIVLVTITLLFTNPALFYFCLQSWQPAFVPATGKFEAVILPGGLSSYDKNGQGYFGQAADRFIQAAKLVHSGVAEKVIVTGGNGFLNRKLPPEADFVKTELIQNGISPAIIFTENKSRNTKENASFTKSLIDSLKMRGPFILVTSAMHMRRCESEFNKVGIRITRHCANYEVTNGFQQWYDWIWPDFSLLEKWNRLNKEIVGWLVSKL